MRGQMSRNGQAVVEHGCYVESVVYLAPSHMAVL